MKRLHPIRNCLANTALIVLSLGAGCKSTSSGVGNPFLAPDRVPPPGTHALLPGQAQPYYQGDPLPSSALAPPNASAGSVAANTTQTTLSPAGRTLAWNAPATAAVSAPTDPVASPPAASTVTTPPQTAVAANEASIAVPTDADPLRYPLPRSPRVEAPPSPAPAVAVAPQNNVNIAQANAATRGTSLQNVLLASYNAPVATPPAVQPITPAVPQQNISPWRSPQLIQPLNSLVNVPQPNSIQPLVGSIPAPPPPSISPIAQQPVAIPTNTMAATLRAVTPPAPPLGDPMPRIRMPDYLPPPPITTADGFRPRTSMQ